MYNAVRKFDINEYKTCMQRAVSLALFPNYLIHLAAVISK